MHMCMQRSAVATIQVRDVPDDVAELIAAKARAENRSVSSYLRKLMAADVRPELQQRAMRQWDAELKETQARLGLPNRSTTPSAEVVREIRDEYDRTQA
jgi:plasmid stability protein